MTLKILNVMLGKDLGGIEQVFLDYTDVLSDAHHQVLQLIHPHAKIKAKCTGEVHTLFNWNQYDFWAIWRLKTLLVREKPDLIITHGNRATQLVRKTRSHIPLYAVCHNYRFKPLLGADHIIALTPDILQKLIEAGQAESTIHLVPNMLKMTESPHPFKPFHVPPIIGFLGRLHPRKACDLFIKALYLLDQKHIDFKAHIAGDGPEKVRLQAQVSALKLGHKISFLGWTPDTQDFYTNIDLFCFPSHSEPFGLVLLEAFHYGKPVVATRSEGPSAIATDGHDLLFSDIGDAQGLADHLEKLIKDQKLAQQLAENAMETLKNYTPNKIGKRLCEVLTKHPSC